MIRTLETQLKRYKDVKLIQQHYFLFKKNCLSKYKIELLHTICKTDINKNSKNYFIMNYF